MEALSYQKSLLFGATVCFAMNSYSSPKIEILAVFCESPLALSLTGTTEGLSNDLLQSPEIEDEIDW